MDWHSTKVKVEPVVGPKIEEAPVMLRGFGTPQFHSTPAARRKLPLDSTLHGLTVKREPKAEELDTKINTDVKAEDADSLDEHNTAIDSQEGLDELKSSQYDNSSQDLEYTSASDDEYLPPCTPANVDIVPRTPRAPRKSAVAARASTRQHFEPGGMLDSQSGETQVLEALGVSPARVPALDFSAAWSSSQALGLENGDGDIVDESQIPEFNMNESQDPDSAEYERDEQRKLQRMGITSLVFQPNDFNITPCKAPTSAHNAAITTPPRAQPRPAPASVPHITSSRVIQNDAEGEVVGLMRAQQQALRRKLFSAMHEMQNGGA